MLVGAGLGEQRAFERGVVAGHHREAVEHHDVAALDPPRGDGVVRAVAVGAGLEPGPCVHELDMRLAAGDLAHHGLRRPERDLVLRDADGDGLHGRRPADVRDAGAFRDPGDLLRGLHHAHGHGGLAGIDQLRGRQRALQLAKVLDGQMVELDADPPTVRDERLHGGEIVVPVPVGIDEIVPEGPASRLAAVHIRRDRRLAVLRHDEAEGAAEGAIEEIAEIGDVVIGGEQAGVDPPRCPYGRAARRAGAPSRRRRMWGRPSRRPGSS